MTMKTGIIEGELMKVGKEFVHPYMPNSVPEIKEEMLRKIGVKSVEEIYKSVIPDELLYKERLVSAGTDLKRA